ncbi:Z1 domain-containing protein [Chryseobacterium aquifrigidense]|uniref:Z1 domain-containing protein n=1 Tax=Chryseobacterium aquifrigidense TaxID=558021 RepID=A0A543EHK8_9FLAO|nr:Z1 domain-containing protein [Chryseobacterium aquifrigidense]TQM21062.1 Z1 domain-containing protein [Chryseobacterium aquifrigidense]
MSRPYNFIKSIVKDNYELFKDSMSYEDAMDMAVSNVLKPLDVKSVDHPSITFSSKEEIRDFLISELQYEVNINQGVEAGEYHTLTDDSGHIPWYRDKVATDKIDFKFWKRYRKYLLNIRQWPVPTVDRLDEITDDIIERLEDPTIKDRAFDRRGLVVGYVQSGKTANFTGLINKAIDSGYKVIIVLSGMHKNLRSQTQMRIDEEVIGRDTSDQAQVKRIGVTTLPGEGYINVDTFTTQNDSGDFSRSFAQQVGGVQPGSDRPMILIVKKNVSVLGNLIRYFRESLDTLSDEYVLQNSEGESILNNLPLLLIDDEADQATPNTRASANDTGELDPTSINRNIRQLLNIFNQKAYVGYTATPFANIFMHHDNEHSLYGKDLFPSSFIISMEAPSNYFGPVQVFGLNESETEHGLPIHITVDDASMTNSDFLPLRHRATDVPDHIPESMKEAIKCFIISSAIRRLRGQGNKHNTMLIHCTRFNDIQNAVGRFVEDEFNRLREGIANDDNDIIQEFKILFERDYIRITTQMERVLHNWDEVRANLKPAVLKMERRPHIINGTAGDILDYKNREGSGLSVIAIGGDKLSRGLTLEGLTISYFTRASTLYDTLMQMGRWFGYRTGFEDLCRIYTTDDLFSWYRHISTAFEILRKEFMEMSRQKSTPMEFGLRVLSHPDMMATNAMKMRHTTTLPLTYKGKLTETSSLSGDRSILVNNSNAVEDFIQALSPFPIAQKENTYLWTGVPKEIVISFLDAYISYRGAPASSTKRIIEFIEKQKEDDSPNDILDIWNVALASLIRNTQEDLVQIAGLDIKPFTRSIKEEFINNRLFIQRLVSPEDEKIDFEIETTATSKDLRALLPRLNRPLITIYPLLIENYRETSEDPVELLSLDKMPFGFAISWPNNHNLKQSTYDINSVYEELELANYD